MSSTGEVGCLGDDFDEALLNALIATGYKIPKQSVLFSSGATKSKVDLLDASQMLHQKGYNIYATAGTAAFLNSHGITTTPVFWPDERPNAENNVMKMIAELPDGYRTVFNLYVFEDKSHKEIAQLLGITEHTSSSQFYRAKTLLAKKINEYRKKL